MEKKAFPASTFKDTYTPTEDDRYITVKEFCYKYSIRTTKAYELMHRPGFPRFKIDGNVRIGEKAAHAFMMGLTG